MRSRFLVLPAILLCLTASDAAAAKAPFRLTVAPSSVARLGPHATATDAACMLGIGPAAASVGAFAGLIYPPNDEYYTLLQGACATCDGGSQRVTAVHAGLVFPSDCAIAGQISIVRSDGELCPRPVVGDVLYGPIAFTAEPEGLVGVPVDFWVDVPGEWCLSQSAFLLVRYTTTTCPGGYPGNLFLETCAYCASYNVYPTGGPDDLCDVLAPFDLTSPVYYVDTACCSSTPTLRQSWGGIKAHYR